MSAVGITRDVFAQRNLDPGQLRAEPSRPIALDEASEALRAAAVDAHTGSIAPALARYTNTVLFGDLWRRADLTPRDRSMVTIAALITAGQVEQLPFHIDRGMDNGLTRSQLAEAIAHLAFYAGWPRAMSAIPVSRSVLDARESSEGKKPGQDG